MSSRKTAKPETAEMAPEIVLEQAKADLAKAQAAVKAARAAAKANKPSRVSVWERAGRILANPEHCQNGEVAESALAELQLATGKDSKTHEQTLARAMEVIRGFQATREQASTVAE